MNHNTHAAHKKKDVKTNQMMRQNHSYNCQSQSHTPLEEDMAVDACEAYISSFFIFLGEKTKNSLKNKQY
jgi:hypothetical protein